MSFSGKDIRRKKMLKNTMAPFVMTQGKETPENRLQCQMMRHMLN